MDLTVRFNDPRNVAPLDPTSETRTAATTAKASLRKDKIAKTPPPTPGQRITRRGGR
jgi:hypothetical protein